MIAHRLLLTGLILVFAVTLGNWGIYQSPNEGGWYDFGFLLGIGALLGGGASASQRSRR